MTPYPAESLLIGGMVEAFIALTPQQPYEERTG
jgi:hypothetical protein